MRIGDLSRTTGVSERLLRYYEEQGLLRPERDSLGRRVYRPDDADVVPRIRVLIEAGVATAVIATLLPCIFDGEQRLIACAELPDRLRAEQARIDAQIAALGDARAALGIMIDHTEDSMANSAN